MTRSRFSVSHVINDRNTLVTHSSTMTSDSSQTTETDLLANDEHEVDQRPDSSRGSTDPARLGFSLLEFLV